MIWALLSWVKLRPQLAFWGAAAFAVIALAFWLYVKGGYDARERIENEANKARVEHLRGAKKAERKIETLDDDDFGSAIDGLPRADTGQ